MGIGRRDHQFTPIVSAIAQAESELKNLLHIRVHISKRWFERDALERAKTLFHREVSGYDARLTSVPTLLFYINLRKRKFGLVTNLELDKNLGHRFWTEISNELQNQFRTTQSERAISKTILKLPQILAGKLQAFRL